MDVNDWRSVVTLVSLLMFMGIVVWAWSKSRQRDFDEAAQLALSDTEPNKEVKP